MHLVSAQQNVYHVFVKLKLQVLVGIVRIAVDLCSSVLSTISEWYTDSIISWSFLNDHVNRSGETYGTVVPSSEHQLELYSNARDPKNTIVPCTIVMVFISCSGYCAYEMITNYILKFLVCNHFQDKNHDNYEIDLDCNSKDFDQFFNNKIAEGGLLIKVCIFFITTTLGGASLSILSKNYYLYTNYDDKNGSCDNNGNTNSNKKPKQYIVKRNESVIQENCNKIYDRLMLNLFFEPILIRQCLVQYLEDNDDIISIIIWQYSHSFSTINNNNNNNRYYSNIPFDCKQIFNYNNTLHQLRMIGKYFRPKTGNAIIVLTKNPLKWPECKTFGNGTTIKDMLNRLIYILENGKWGNWDGKDENVATDNDTFSMQFKRIKVYISSKHKTTYAYIIKFSVNFDIRKYQIKQLEEYFVLLRQIVGYFHQDIVVPIDINHYGKQNICLNFANFVPGMTVEKLKKRKLIKLNQICNILWSSYKSKRCNVCHKRGIKLKWCKHCKKILYCSKKCQKHDWKFGKHYQVCY